ncbi:hypothetical protein AB4144_45600, partial [Rhizobiaceae sp. 2RAB30]
ASLEEGAALREKEVASLDQQSADVANKLEATRTELDQVRALAKRDLAVNKLFPLERTFADVKREQQAVEIDRLRAMQELSGLRRSVADLEARRHSEALAGIQRVDAQLRDIEEQKRSLLRLVDGAAYYSSLLADSTAAEDQQQLRFTIVRTDAEGKISEIDATETTEVQPGDIVKVVRLLDMTT